MAETLPSPCPLVTWAPLWSFPLLFLTFFLSFFFFYFLSMHLSVGSDSAQKVGLQPCHVSVWLQGQYQTCPWRWQCKYRCSWKQTLSHFMQIYRHSGCVAQIRAPLGAAIFYLILLRQKRPAWSQWSEIWFTMPGCISYHSDLIGN